MKNLILVSSAIIILAIFSLPAGADSNIPKFRIEPVAQKPNISNWLTYNSAGNRLAKGQSFTIMYPPNFKASNDPQGDFVQQFRYDNNSKIFYMTVTVINLPPRKGNNAKNNFKKSDGSIDSREAHAFLENIFSTVSKDLGHKSAKVIKKGTHDGYPFLDYENYSDFWNGKYVDTFIRLVVLGPRQIDLNCNYFHNEENDIKKFNAFRDNICIPMFDSLTIF
jgi:hypothetical protein